jgi:hypothetical protein
MKISTGLEPVVKAWNVPVLSDPTARYIDPSTTLSIPTYGIKVVWIVEFMTTEDDIESPRGRVVHAMLFKTEPKVEKKHVSYSIADEHPSKAETESYYRMKERVPEDAQKVVHHSPQMLTDVHLHWFEVTL